MAMVAHWGKAFLVPRRAGSVAPWLQEMRYPKQGAVGRSQERDTVTAGPA